MSNLLPSLDEIVGVDASNDQNTPLGILKEQCEFIKQLHPSLASNLDIDRYYQGDEPLFNLSLAPRKIETNAPVTRILNGAKQVLARLFITRSGITYQAEILRIKFNKDSNYPMDLMDCCNVKMYCPKSKENFEERLREIFHSDQFKRIVNYIISGPIA